MKYLRFYPQLKYSKTKVLLPQSWVTLYDLAILLSVFGFPAPKYVEIIWFCNILALSLPDESFSRSASCALNLISKFLLEGNKNNIKRRHVYSLFGDSENREKMYLKIRDLLSIALFNILGTHYLIHI